MSQKQREMADQTFRDSPFDPAGDVLAQRPLLEKMLTAEPPPEDVIVTPGTLGDSPALFLEIADQETTGVVLFLHGGFFALGSATSPDRSCGLIGGRWPQCAPRL
jgi:epsilon-lactone hydrolase